MKILHITGLFFLIIVLSACGKLGYYAHSINGHLSIMGKRQNIATLIKNPKTDAKLRKQLQQVQQIRRFASNDLLLPKNKSYTKYADLKQKYVVWNVFATPEFSTKPKTWCFIITGCVGYRGYFDEALAKGFAKKMKQQGYDVYMGGVTAYSTLGWFADPVLNTFVYYPAPRLAGLIFHELAHQKLYVKDDSVFNESFAMTVELEGTRRWFAKKKAESDFKAFVASKKRHQRFVVLILRYRNKLQQLYQNETGNTRLRPMKAAIFQQLKSEYKELRKSWGGYHGYDRWFAQDLNNAHLASIGTYHDFVPSFQTILKQANGDLGRFYQQVMALTKLPKAERDKRLLKLKKPPG